MLFVLRPGIFYEYTPSGEVTKRLMQRRERSVERSGEGPAVGSMLHLERSEGCRSTPVRPRSHAGYACLTSGKNRPWPPVTRAFSPSPRLRDAKTIRQTLPESVPRDTAPARPQASCSADVDHTRCPSHIGPHLNKDWAQAGALFRCDLASRPQPHGQTTEDNFRALHFLLVQQRPRDSQPLIDGTMNEINGTNWFATPNNKLLQGSLDGGLCC